ncbi:MAG TPA: LacI family DNA-binding transcriptional regulator [Jiangellales bacterium]|nr:LacI family DNA-binding transcriptional regulator [Jiangellales bacterium]
MSNRGRGNDAGSVPTMRMVAARANVSAMTVSRVLEGAPGVRPQTRDRVLAAVEELGYRRNQIARSLRVGQATGLLGLVVTNLANPFYAQLALGAESAIAAHGMRVILGNTGEDVEHERRLVDDFASRRVDGMVVVPAGTDHRHLGPDELADIPVVLVTRPARGVDLDAVLIDDFGGAHAATARLIAAGHSRIGFLGLSTSVWNITERFRGFTAALEQAHLKPNARHVRRNPPEIAAAEQAARDLLTTRNPPTALFCANNLNTMGAVRAITAAGTTTTVAGFDDFELADMLGLPLMVVSYDAQAIGREAARMLLARLNHDRSLPRPPSQQTILPTRVVQHGPLQSP